MDYTNQYQFGTIKAYGDKRLKGGTREAGCHAYAAWNMDGAVGDSIRSFLSEVHQPVAAGLQQAMSDMQVHLLQYADGFYQIEQSHEGDIRQDVLEGTQEGLQKRQGELEGIAAAVKDVLQSIGDIVTIGIPSDGSTKDSFEASVQSLATLNDKIGSHDAAHEQDTAAMKDILNTVSALMNQYGAEGVSAEAYEPGSILTEGTKIRVDAIGVDKNTGNVVINEFKSSQTAPLTPNQKVGFPQLEAGGGTVVGNGKGIFTGGFEVPAGTKVEIIRPPK